MVFDEADPGAEMFSYGRGDIPGGVGRCVLIDGEVDCCV